jgi:nitrite reductase/ring-hydroxylating ferredoxin subunit/uncharacterized membrane protein
METNEIVDIIESQEWVSPVADGLASGVKAAFDAVGSAAQPIKNVLHGTFLGHPLHPVLTDIPLGAWTVAAALDVAELFGVSVAADGADAAVAIGLVGALASAVTGLTDWHVVDDEKPKKIGAVHAVLNIAATALYGASWILRKNNSRGFARVLAGAGYGLVGASAYLGGMLVFDQKIGVDHADRDNVADDWTAVISESDLVEGKPALVTAGDLQVVLVKQEGVVRALGNLCSHLAGPLCEGKVEGATIICPWHGSRFDLNSGAAIDGPATASQPVLRTRIRDGQVEVCSA